MEGRERERQVRGGQKGEGSKRGRRVGVEGVEDWLWEGEKGGERCWEGRRCWGRMLIRLNEWGRMVGSR